MTKQQRWSRTPQGQFAHAKCDAKKRNLEWTLTKEVFIELRLLPCTYCGGTLPEAGSGLDRKDNLKGYISGNVVPCCFRCNYMKGKFLTYDEMKLIWSHRLQRG
jgi:hypothetical protein